MLVTLEIRNRIGNMLLCMIIYSKQLVGHPQCDRVTSIRWCEGHGCLSNNGGN